MQEKTISKEIILNKIYLLCTVFYLISLRTFEQTLNLMKSTNYESHTVIYSTLLLTSLFYLTILSLSFPVQEQVLHPC